MNLLGIKNIFCLALIIVFLIMAFMTNDAASEQLFASLGIVTGALALKYLSTQKSTTDEKS